MANDGTVFITGAVTGSEMDALLSAMFDGITFIRDNGHAYFPSDWLRENYPDAANLVNKIERAVRAHFYWCDHAEQR